MNWIWVLSKTPVPSDSYLQHTKRGKESFLNQPLSSFGSCFIIVANLLCVRMSRVMLRSWLRNTTNSYIYQTYTVSGRSRQLLFQARRELHHFCSTGANQSPRMLVSPWKVQVFLHLSVKADAPAATETWTHSCSCWKALKNLCSDHLLESKTNLTVSGSYTVYCHVRISKYPE